MSTPSKCRPNKIISAPAIGGGVVRFSRKNEPTALADAPNEMKTVENPTTNESADAKSPPRGCCPCRNCSMPTPDNIEIYPGTSGSTHGERNETSPARNEAANEKQACLREMTSRPMG